MQKCSKCKTDKTLDQFSKGNKKNGTSSWCKDCDDLRRKEYGSKPEVKKRAAERQQRRRYSDPSKAMLNNVRSNAKRQRIEFNLTVEDCLIPSHCPVLGIPLVGGLLFRPSTGCGGFTQFS